MDQFHLSEVAYFDADILKGYEPQFQRANIKRYINQSGQINEIYDVVDEDGVVMGSGISTNVEPEPR
jgi:hypothetical protein